MEREREIERDVEIYATAAAHTATDLLIHSPVTTRGLHAGLRSNVLISWNNVLSGGICTPPGPHHAPAPQTRHGITNTTDAS
jgi:hypothetical protein